MKRIAWGMTLSMLVLYFGYRGVLQWQIQEHFRFMEKRGYPTTLAELDASYALPPGAQNAAEDLARAAEVFARIEESQEAAASEDWAELEELDRRYERGELTEEAYHAECERLHVAQEAQMGEEFNNETEVLKEHWALLEQLEKGEIDQETYDIAFAELSARVPGVLEEVTDFLEDDLPSEAGPLDAVWRAGLREALEAHTEAIAHLRAAAAKDVARFPFDFKRWEEDQSIIEHLGPLRDATRLLQRDAVFKSDAGDLAGAATSIADALRIADMPRLEPTLISQLVRTACLAIALSGLEFTLNRGALTREQLDLVRNALPPEPVSEGYARGHAGECCLTRKKGFKIRDTRPGEMEFTEDGDFSEVPGPYWSWRLVYEIPYALAGLQQWDQLYFLKLARAADSLYPVPPVARWQAIKKISEWSEAPPPAILLGSMQTMSLSPTRIVSAALRIDTMLDVTRCVLAIEAFRQDKGVLPESLDQLADDYLQEVPLDPFDGAPLRYRREDVGYVVYSIGQDETDNGGVRLEHFAMPGGDYPMRIAR